MIIKLVLTFKIDSGSWIVINAIQLVRSFILINADMPYNLRNFLAVGIASFNLNLGYGIELLKKMIPKINIEFPDLASYLP